MDSMLDFENAVRNQVEEGSTVRYRVTPVYKGSRTAPESFQMSYISWDSAGRLDGAASTTVSNLIYADRCRCAVGGPVAAADPTPERNRP